MFRKIFGANRDKGAGGLQNCILYSLMICTVGQVVFGDQVKEDDMSGT